MKKSISLSKTLLGLSLFLGSTALMAQNELALVTTGHTTEKLESAKASYDYTTEHETLAISQVREYLINHIEYPEMARAYDIEGMVVIEVKILSTGQIEQATIVKSLSPTFNQAAIKALDGMEKINIAQKVYQGAHTVHIPIRFTNAY